MRSQENAKITCGKSRTESQDRHSHDALRDGFLAAPPRHMVREDATRTYNSGDGLRKEAP